MEPKYQYFRSHSSLVRLKVTENPSTGLCYIFWGDLRVAFPGIARVQDGDIFVPFMRCQREFRLKPFRIEYIPDSVLDVIYKDEVNSDIKLKTSYKGSKKKTKDSHTVDDHVGESHVVRTGTVQDVDDNIQDHPMAQSPRDNVHSASKTSSLPLSVSEFDSSLISPSPSLSPSPSPSQSPTTLPRTPDSLATELMGHEYDTLLPNSSVDINAEKSLAAVDEAITSQGSHGSHGSHGPHGSHESTNQAHQESFEPDVISEPGSREVTHSGPSPSLANMPIDISKMYSSGQSLEVESDTASHLSKLGTVMSLVKGLSLQVAGSAMHKEVYDAAAKHSVEISELDSIISGSRREPESGIFLEPGQCIVNNVDDDDDDEDDDNGADTDIFGENGKPSYPIPIEKLYESRKALADKNHSKKDDAEGAGNNHETRNNDGQLQQKKQQVATSKQKSQAPKQTKATNPPQSTISSKSKRGKTNQQMNATPAVSKTQLTGKVNPYSLLTNAMPLLLQSGLFSEYTGSITGTNSDPRANALVDVIASYQESEELLAFNRMNGPRQRVPTRQGLGRLANENGSVITNTIVRNNIDEWTEIGQLIKVFTQAAAKGNLRIADKMGLQLERKLFDLERRMVTQPELKSKVLPVMESFQESHKKLMPLRKERIQKNARTLLEQRLSLTENIVPNMFVVLPKSLETNPIQLRVYFLCQCRGEDRCHISIGKEEGGEAEKSKPQYLPSHFGHLTDHPGYELVFDQQLIMVGGLYMYDLLELMKYGVTLEDVHVDQDDDEGEEDESRGDSALHSDNKRKTKTIVVPPLNPRSNRAEAELYFRVNYAMEHIIGSRCVEASHDGIKSFLKGVSQEIKLPSSDESLGGLVRVLSSQGSTRWLCDDHYNALHRAPRMSAFVRLIEGQKAVPIFWEYHLGQVQVLFPSRKELQVFLNILKTLRAPIQDLTLMLDWPLTALDIQQLHQSLHAFAVNIPSIRICLGKGSMQEDPEEFKQSQDKLISSMLAKPEVHLFLLEDAVLLQEEWDASTRLFANHKELNFDNWERYPNTRAVIVKNASGFIKLGIVVESTEAGLELVKRYFGGEGTKSKTLMGLQLYANKHDAVKYEFKDGVMTDVCLSATSSSPKKLLQVSNIELLQFKVLTKQDRNEFESILKRNPTICEVEVHCSMEIMPEMFTLLKKWRRGHNRPPSVRIEHGETKLWWIQELFNCEAPSLELSVMEPYGLGPILELVAPELRTFEGPLLDSQAATFLNMLRKKGANLTELDLDISYLTPTGFESIFKIIEMCKLEMFGIMVSSRSPVSNVQLETSTRNQKQGAISPTMDWVRIAGFINRVRNVSRSFQVIGPDVSDILHNLQPKLDPTQLFALKKVEIYGGKSVSLHPTKGLPMIISILSKVALWTVKLVDVRIDPESWIQILEAINFQRLIWLDIRQSGFGPNQMDLLVEKVPKNSAMKKMYIRMGSRPTGKQLQHWRITLARKTVNMNFLCEMDERAPNEIGMRVRDIRF
ncbi:hypothetical protein BGZ49_003119 [Haplosporangium sp. Z 27]|nr:hypothetical protein BGZ49_003119 [Haplosporangium sp. Z 27]